MTAVIALNSNLRVRASARDVNPCQLHLIRSRRSLRESHLPDINISTTSWRRPTVDWRRPQTDHEGVIGLGDLDGYAKPLHYPTSIQKMVLSSLEHAFGRRPREESWETGEEELVRAAADVRRGQRRPRSNTYTSSIADPHTICCCICAKAQAVAKASIKPLVASQSVHQTCG